MIPHFSRVLGIMAMTHPRHAFSSPLCDWVVFVNEHSRKWAAVTCQRALTLKYLTGSWDLDSFLCMSQGISCLHTAVPSGNWKQPTEKDRLLSQLSSPPSGHLRSGRLKGKGLEKNHMLVSCRLVSCGSSSAFLISIVHKRHWTWCSAEVMVCLVSLQSKVWGEKGHDWCYRSRDESSVPVSEAFSGFTTLWCWAGHSHALQLPEVRDS